MHTTRSLRSAARPVGLAYNKPQLGREALPLCLQLGENHTGPMGPTVHSIIPVRSYPNPNSHKESHAQGRSTKNHRRSRNS